MERYKRGPEGSTKKKPEEKEAQETEYHPKWNQVDEQPIHQEILDERPDPWKRGRTERSEENPEDV